MRIKITERYEEVEFLSREDDPEWFDEIIADIPYAIEAMKEDPNFDEHIADGIYDKIVFIELVDDEPPK